MSYTYSILNNRGSVVIGNYTFRDSSSKVVSETAIPELDAQVGKSLARSINGTVDLTTADDESQRIAGLGFVQAKTNPVTGKIKISNIGNVNTRPQTAVLFGDSGIQDGWESYQTVSSAILQDGNGNAFAAINGSGLNYVPGNQMFIGSAIAPYSGVFTVTSKVTSSTSVVNVSSASIGSGGCVRLQFATAHGMAAGGVCSVSGIVGTTEANDSFFYNIIDGSTIELVNSTYTNAYVSGGSAQQRGGIGFSVPASAPLRCSGLAGLGGYWLVPCLEKPTRRSWFMNIQSQLGFPFEVLNFAAVNGQPTAEMASRIDTDVIAYNPGWCFMHAGANDVRVRGLTPAIAASNTYALIQTCLNAGIKVAYILWQPDNSTDTAYAAGAMNGKCLQFHAALRNLCAGNDDVVFIDQWPSLSNPASATGDAATNMLKSTDGIHTSNLGGQSVGSGGSSVLKQYVSPMVKLPTSHMDSKAQSALSLQLFSNPILLTATGGVVTAPLTTSTSIPANVTVARIAGAPTGTADFVARTLIADGDVIGNNVKAVLTGSANNDQVIISFNLTAADVSPGDVIEACCHVRSSGALAGLVNMITGMIDINAYAYKAFCHGPSLAGVDYPLNDVNEYLRVRMVVPSGISITAAKFSIIVQFSGIGSAVTVNVGRVAVRKINRPCFPM